MPNQNNPIADIYRFCTISDKNGNQIPVFPYVVAILGHRSFGASIDNNPQAFDKIRKVLKSRLEQILVQWERLAGKRFPLILLTGLSGGSDQLVTELALELQQKHSCLNIMAILPNEYTKYCDYLNGISISSRDNFMNLYKRFTENDPKFQNRRYIMELTDNLSDKEQKELDKLNCRERDKKIRARQDRRFNEFLVMHSHTLIAVWDGKEKHSAENKYGIAWAVRFKLEGFDRQPIHGDTDELTYSAIGPVIHILADEDHLSDPGNQKLPVYYYHADEELTEERPTGREFISRDKFINQSKRWGWGGNIAKNFDIYNVLKKLGKLNNVIWSRMRNTTQRPIEEYSKQYIVQHYKNNDVNPLYVTNNGLVAEAGEIYLPSHDDQTLHIINHFRAADQIASFYRTNTKGVIWLYSVGFFVCFAAGILYTFLSVLLFRGYDLASWKLLGLQSAQWLKAQPCIQTHENMTSVLTNFENTYISHSCAQAIAHFSTVSCDAWIVNWLWGCVIAILLSLGVITYCYLSSCCTSCHFKYHQFRALAESLRVQIFWRIAGLNSTVSDNFRSHQIDTIDWLRVALNGLDVCTLASPIPNDRFLRLRFVDKAWIECQKKYIAKRLSPSKRSWCEPINFTKLFWLKTKNFVDGPFCEGTRKFFIGFFLLIICVTPIINNYQTDVLITAAMTNSSCTSAADMSASRLVATPGMIVWLVYSLLASFFIINFAYQRMTLKKKKLFMLEQLKTPFTLADYLLDVISGNNSRRLKSHSCDSGSPIAQSSSAASENVSNDACSTESFQTGESRKSGYEMYESDMERCRIILHQLGQESLAKYADWLLAATDRELMLPR